MSTMHTPLFGSFQQYCIERIERTAKEIIPAKFKRAIFISTIAGLVRQVTKPDEELVNRLNNVFKLAGSPQTMAIPMQVKSVIWRRMSDRVEMHGQTVSIYGADKQNLNPSDMQTMAEHFSKNVPPWLKYGSADLMTRDALTVLDQLRRDN